MSNELMALLSLLFGGGGIITGYVALRKLNGERAKIAADTKETNARAANEELDTMGGLRDVLEKYQADLQRLYTENAELQKWKAEKTQTIKTLEDRLAERDTQLNTLQKLANDSQIVATVNNQLSAMNDVIANLEAARSEAVELLKQQTKQVSDLVQTNRDLSLHKPPKS